jgi:hypothetical protein
MSLLSRVGSTATIIDSSRVNGVCQDTMHAGLIPASGSRGSANTQIHKVLREPTEAGPFLQVRAEHLGDHWGFCFFHTYSRGITRSIRVCPIAIGGSRPR